MRCITSIVYINYAYPLLKCQREARFWCLLALTSAVAFVGRWSANRLGKGTKKARPRGRAFIILSKKYGGRAGYSRPARMLMLRARIAVLKPKDIMP